MQRIFLAEMSVSLATFPTWWTIDIYM